MDKNAITRDEVKRRLQEALDDLHEACYDAVEFADSDEQAVAIMKWLIGDPGMINTVILDILKRKF